MKKMMQLGLVISTVLMGATVTYANDAAEGIDAAKLFKKKCAMCHAIDKNKTGPAVKGMNSDSEALRSAITNGQNRMPKFGEKFSAEEIDALVLYIQAQK
ncbi:MAG: hypothetical protein AUK35_08710 [Zetaproteobacteria bacterium CG2_30_46_52]|nr:MAG: hypothetical protein AUK35_08710 [Zetaproteobacteria bacterium CG2_30_46_52]